MTFYDDLETVIEAKIESEYNATLADIGDAVPFNLSLPELLKIRDYLKTQNVSIVGTIPNLSITNTSFIATQSTAANLNATVVFASPQAVTQSGTWTTARSWSLASGSDSVAIGGTLPAFASTPTVNIGTNASIEYGAGATTGATQRIAIANDQNTVIRVTSAQQTRAANTTPYSVFDSYGGIGILTGLVSGGSYVLQSFELAIDIAAIPSSMALSVMFFDSQSAAQSSGSFIADNALMTNVIPNSFADSRGVPLTLAVVAGKVIAHTGAINRIIKLASGQTSLHFYIMATAVFTPAANSETMSAKAVLGTY